MSIDYRFAGLVAFVAGYTACFFSAEEYPGKATADASSTGGGQVGGAGGDGGTGQGSGGKGGAGACEPGMAQLCYNGPPGTDNIGACRPGQQTCDAMGAGFGPCQGAVMPDEEICGNGLDDDCNGQVDPTGECLVDRGLIVRYFINEAESGHDPAVLKDAAPEPLDLTIDYNSELDFSNVDDHRGLAWPANANDGMVGTPADNTKIWSKLNTSMTGTLEVIVAIGATMPGYYSRISYFGHDSHDIFSLSLRVGSGDSSDSFFFNHDDVLDHVAFPTENDGMSQRMVLHLVLDTTILIDSERVKLYKNGSPVAGATGNFPWLGKQILLLNGEHYILGNRSNGGKPFNGTLFYAAMYSDALTASEIKTNADLLLIDDDALGAMPPARLADR